VKKIGYKPAVLVFAVVFLSLAGVFFILNKLIPGKGKDTEEALIAFKQISLHAYLLTRLLALFIWY
jgi:hypothetical protein